MNLMGNVDSKQSEINEAAVKIIFYCENCNIVIAVIAYIMMSEAYSEPEPYKRLGWSVLQKK